jgi:hypothetical protein
MTGSNKRPCRWRAILGGAAVLATIGLTGCQVEVGNQTLPSPYYLTNDVQYYPPGPEFKLAKEAAAQQAWSQEQAARQ